MENSWENFAFFCFYWFNFAVFLSCEKGKFKSFSILGHRPHLCRFLFILLLRKLLLNLGDHENALHFNIKRVFKPCEVKQDENLHLNRARRLLNCFKRHKVQSDDNLFKKILYPPFESLKILSLCLSLQLNFRNLQKNFLFCVQFSKFSPPFPTQNRKFHKKTSKWHWLMSFHLKNTRKNTILILSCHYKVLMIFQYLRFSLEKNKFFFLFLLLVSRELI